MILLSLLPAFLRPCSAQPVPEFTSGAEYLAYVEQLREDIATLEAKVKDAAASAMSKADELRAQAEAETDPVKKQPLLDELLFRIDSALISRRKKYIVMNLPEDAIEQAVQIVPAMRSPTIMPLAAKGWYAMHAVIDEAQLWEKIRQLKAIGAEGILVLNTDKIIP